MEGRFRYFTKFHLILEFLCLIVAVSLLVYFAVNWGSVNGPVPTHFNAGGQVDAWGDKNSLLIELLVAFGLYIILSVVELFPNTWNMPVKVTEENHDRLIHISLYMMITMKFFVLVIFFLLIYFSMSALPLPVWLLPVYLIVLFSTIALFIIKLIHARKQPLL